MEHEHASWALSAYATLIISLYSMVVYGMGFLTHWIIARMTPDELMKRMDHRRGSWGSVVNDPEQRAPGPIFTIQAGIDSHNNRPPYRYGYHNPHTRVFT